MTTRREPKLLEAFLTEAVDEGASAEAMEMLALAAPVVPMSPSLRDRLTHALTETNRFDDFEATVAGLADLSIDQARALLVSIDDPSAPWDPGPGPGIDLLGFEGGPRRRNAVTGIVRHAPGARFPEHDHVGDEAVLVLQGALEDEDGAVHRPGALLLRGPKSPHAYRAVGPLPLLTVAIIEGGVTIGDVTIPPGDPRA